MMWIDAGNTDDISQEIQSALAGLMFRADVVGLRFSHLSENLNTNALVIFVHG
jgi:hypothetical protein